MQTNHLIKKAPFAAAILLALLSCNNNQKKISSEEWKKGVSTDYNEREFMVNDLTANHLKKGITYSQVISILGSPDFDSEKRFPEISYQTKEFYGSDIDPIETESLELFFNNDSTLSRWELKQYKNK